MADPYAYPAAAPRRRRPDVAEAFLAVLVRIVVDHWLELSLLVSLAVPAVAAGRTAAAPSRDDIDLGH
jgi:hypothetical protein